MVRLILYNIEYEGGLHELDKLMKETHLTDTAKIDYSRIKYTEPAWKPSKRLDYILVSKKIDVKEYEVLQADFSDHLPVIVDFEVK